MPGVSPLDGVSVTTPVLGLEMVTFRSGIVVADWLENVSGSAPTSNAGNVKVVGESTDISTGVPSNTVVELFEPTDWGVVSRNGGGSFGSGRAVT